MPGLRFNNTKASAARLTRRRNILRTALRANGIPCVVGGCACRLLGFQRANLPHKQPVEPSDPNFNPRTLPRYSNQRRDIASTAGTFKTTLYKTHTNHLSCSPAYNNALGRHFHQRSRQACCGSWLRPWHAAVVRGCETRIHISAHAHWNRMVAFLKRKPWHTHPSTRLPTGLVALNPVT